MDLITSIYTALGIIVTIIGTYWGIRYTYKYKTKTQLIYFENSCIPLYRKVVKDLKGLEIIFKGKPVDRNLIVYKGTIFNSGNTDIDKVAIHKPLKIILPNGFEWKEVAIIDKSDDVNINISVNSESSTFEFDILKENEYFTFDSVIEYKPQISNEDDSNFAVENISRHLSKNIKIHQRITNLKSVEKENIPSKPISIWGISVVSLFLLLLVLFLFLYETIFPVYKVYYEMAIDSTFNYVAFKSNNKNEIKLIDTLNNNIGTYNIDNPHNNKFTGKIIIHKENPSNFGLIAGLIFSLIILYFCIGFIQVNLKTGDLYNKVKRIADKYDYNDFPERKRTAHHEPTEYLIREDGKSSPN